MSLFAAPATGQGIDRRTVVSRHNVRYDRYSPTAPLQVGNGEFAFAFDVTGLQTFPSSAPDCPPLGAMAQWAWHSFPEVEDYSYADTLREYPAHGRMVSYATDRRSPAAQAIRRNPHRFNLARIGLKLTDNDGGRAEVGDLSEVSQELVLWTGEAHSRFRFDGQPVEVRTVAHPSLDAVAFAIESPLVASGQLAIEVSFPYPSGEWGPQADNWDATDRHTSTAEQKQSGVRVLRTLDNNHYTVDVSSTGRWQETDRPHSFLVTNKDKPSLEAVLLFKAGHKEGAREALDYSKVRQASGEHWAGFWESGGMVDLSGSSDPRWRELERRVVLSQYLTAIQCAGSLPPQETGLLCNSWHGKSHLEMHWWHAAHFTLWGRHELLDRSLGWYEQILPAARSIAQRQGYAGVRWPKMTGPHGVSSPSDVGELLIWQQPHPIYFAELAYRAKPDRATLECYQPIVEQTAEFMADYAYLDEQSNRYVLGPVLIPAQECYEGRSADGVLNPTFELAYWRWALQTAGAWRQRLGLPPNKKWADVAEHIAPPHQRQGVYTAIANPPFTNRHDHPSMLAALGVLPDVGLVDRAVMLRTLEEVRADWEWKTTWGWDYPMMAMTAARVGRGDLAVDCLLQDAPKNNYLPNGHCFQENRLPVYLPANGGLLSAVAMMAAGWDSDQPLDDAPGFPRDGTWTVRHEGLLPMP